MSEIYVTINDIEKMQYKRKPKLARLLEFDLAYIPIEHGDSESERALQQDPLELIIMDWQSGEMLAHDFFPLARTAEHCQQIFWEVLRALPNRLMQMAVSREMKQMLSPLQQLLDIELVESELPTIADYRDFIQSHDK